MCIFSKNNYTGFSTSYSQGRGKVVINRQFKYNHQCNYFSNYSKE